MMSIVQPSPEVYQQAKELFERGELVAFPTETIYGLGAHALDEQAVQKIFEVKGRPSSNPLIVHIGDSKQITELAEISNAVEQAIIDRFFPGPITLLLKKKAIIPALVSSNPYVGIRMPSNTIALDLLKAVHMPIAAPSANISGKPSPTNAEMVADNIGDQIELIIDGGDSDFGIESSVVRVIEEGGNNRIEILRPGYISKEDLEIAFEGQDIPISYSSKQENISPGMRFKHYKPSGEVLIFWKEKEIRLLPPRSTALIATEEWFAEHPEYQEKKEQFIPLVWGAEKNLSSCAHRLFQLYHQCEKAGIKRIYIQQLPEQGLGFAIMNRVKRSAEH